MTPLKKKGCHIVLELLYNNKHKICCFVAENSFKNFKNNYKKNLIKFDLHMVFFVPNAFTACYLLHNILQSRIVFHLFKNQ
jgi:hypothetical protein